MTRGHLDDREGAVPSWQAEPRLTGTAHFCGLGANAFPPWRSVVQPPTLEEVGINYQAREVEPRERGKMGTFFFGSEIAHCSG